MNRKKLPAFRVMTLNCLSSTPSVPAYPRSGHFAKSDSAFQSAGPWVKFLEISSSGFIFSEKNPVIANSVMNTVKNIFR